MIRPYTPNLGLKIKIIAIFFSILLGISISYLSIIETKYLLFVLFLCILLSFVLFFITRLGVIKTLYFLFFLCLPFNIELRLYETYHPGGLPSAITLNHFMIVITLLFLLEIYTKNESFISLKNPVFKNIEFKLFVILFILGAISTLFAVNKVAASYILIRNLFIIILYILLGSKDFQSVWNKIIISLSIISMLEFLLGVLQLIRGSSIGIFFLGENINPFREGVDVDEQGISGTLGHPGTFGLFYLLVSPLLITTVLNFRNALDIPKKKVLGRYLLVLAGVICAIGAVILSNARTSIVILGLDVIFIVFLSYLIKIKHNPKNAVYILHIFFISLIVVFAFALIANIIIDRFINSDFNHQYGYRNMLNQMAYEIIFNDVKTILFGIGPNNYTDIISRYGEGFAYSNPVHNLYLLFWAESGVFFLIFYIVILLSIILKMLLVVFKGNLKLSLKAVGILASTVNLAIYNFTGWAPYHNQNFYMFSIICILSFLLYTNYKKSLTNSGNNE